MPTDVTAHTESAGPVALVPLRSPGDGKTRLAPALDRSTRARLAAAMLADVVAAVQAAGLHVVVAAGGPAAVDAATSIGVDVVEDPPGVRSLDDVIAHAQRRLPQTNGLLVVQGDLPLLTSDDVRAVCEPDAPVVLAPTDDAGTAALLRRPADVMGTAFGPGSADAHTRLARAAGITPRIVHRAGLALDVDVLADLRSLGTTAGPSTAAVVADLPRT